MSDYFNLAQIDEAAQVLRSQIPCLPRVGLILGSGLGELANLIQNPTVVPFTAVPYVPATTIQGHVGKFIFGTLQSQAMMVMQGRIHYYEGYSLAEVTLPIRLMQRLGVEILIVTNAAGAINPDYAPGDLMLISDHINVMGMSGLNPLRGPNLAELGERFPDMSQPYDHKLLALAAQAAEHNHLKVHQGVYAGLSGPSFESPADLRFLRVVGADAVGMSTVPEVIIARHGRTRVLGISGISNKANLDGNTETTHEEVLEAGKVIAPKLTQIVLGVLGAL